MSSTVFTRLQVPSALRVFQAEKSYRAGVPAASLAYKKMDVKQALDSAVFPISFLHVDTLKGVPVKKGLSAATFDPYISCHIRDVYNAHFGAPKPSP
uniref:Uncharacterized protein n=1 Tax=Chromera velia CCMP2878 TaxID=1169474 RepID=A0A0G4H191_9ALVE|mmetsp:Transcript_8390/g.16283  ORF Transcript_8390/g.16283 Transcript_8390/m.16283 type:complete len:97 (-) Transcript_8390:286-576(-)|eukprot:Cvel_24271.t1-p1 / transcript=Cvel_24271.t1 / gene=Cvel_24271 / organism=Chromera_velia_CCMP2878 / gene_product=hypothetical protein / transcript_product=hypothetical protein / location=Cvel_scaffold2602:22862-23236(+) / protein_length=96 / sequence_SO=supercontig / SO=protein_coding / is_pseudo=false